MSIHPISTNSLSQVPPQEDISPEDATHFAKLSAQEAHKKLVDANTKYIFDQMVESSRRFTQTMIREAKERQKDE